MSQFFSPYTPPSVSILDAGAPRGLMEAPRRAGMLMLVLGALALLMGVQSLMATAVIPAQQLLDQERSFLAGAKDMPLPPADQLHRMAIGMCVGIIVVGAMMVVLGVAVRRGSQAGTGLALALTSLLLLVFGIAALAFLLAGLVEPVVLPMVLLPGVPLMLMAWQMAWLIGAGRASAAMVQARQRSADQHWQFQQSIAAAAMSGGGYGYGAAPGEATGAALPAAWQSDQPSDSERGK